MKGIIKFIIIVITTGFIVNILFYISKLFNIDDYVAGYSVGWLGCMIYYISLSIYEHITKK